MTMSRPAILLSATFLLAACEPSREHRRADTARTAAATEQTRLARQLAAQKDSLTRVVLEADDFIMRLDSTVSSVRGVSRRERGERLDPLAQQIQNRREVMSRVDALVARARSTARQLAASQRLNAELRTQIENDQKMIADLNTTIQRQSENIGTLSMRIDSLTGVTVVLGDSIERMAVAQGRAYYVIGRADDLVKQGIIVREGGANLLVARVGRTLQTARTLDPDAFTSIDARRVREIAVPDSTRKYTVVSRQSLDAADVASRDDASFRGNLRIAHPDRFWSQSRFLVIVAN